MYNKDIETIDDMLVKKITLSELESTVLGEILNEPKIIDEVRVIINANCFKELNNQLIYKTMLELNDEGKAIDSVSIYEKSKKNKANIDPFLISKLSEGISSSAHFRGHSITLLEYWMKRELYKKTQSAQERLKKGDDVFEIITSLSEDVYQIENNVIIEKDRHLWEEYPRLIQQVEDRYSGKTKEGLMSDSFPTLNRATGGIMESDFVVVYGEEKRAKTTVSERLILDFAFQGVPVGIFTLEMDFDTNAYKALSMEGGLEYLKFRNPKGNNLTTEEFARFNQKALKFEKTKIFIDDKTFDFDRIIGKMKIWKRKHNIGIFVIDYLGLIESARKFEQRRLEIKHYSRRLKNLCKEIKTPIIAVSQANTEGKSAESIDPLRDCDFALRCIKPIEDNYKTMQIGNETYSFTEDDFMVIVERSRHGKNRQNLLCGYVGTDFKEKVFGGGYE